VSAPPASTPTPAGRRRIAASSRVALGIFSSRVLGLVRESTFAAVFGVGAHADVLAAVLRGPILLQNLLGEQTLSASFIPVYSRLLASGKRRAAGRFAGAVLALLAVAAGTAALVGVLLARPFVGLTAPGYLADAGRIAAGVAAVDRFELAVQAIRFTFPMAAVLVLAAWALGVLNSHRRFFLPYVAPALWNLVIIGIVLVAASVWLPGGLRQTLDVPSPTAVAGDAAAASWGLLDRLLLTACGAALLGAFAQLGVQLPLVFKLLRGFRLRLSLRVEGMREALRAFGPAVAARGAAQLSVYVDQVLASLAMAGAPSAIRWAGILYILPLSLFAQSVAVAELPEMARAMGTVADDKLAGRARFALRQIAFLVLPTALGFIALGRLLVGAIYQRGSFTDPHTLLVYLTLVGYSLGLPAVCWSRALVNVFWARGDTSTPARIAGLRMGLAAAVGAGLMFWLDRFPLETVAASGAGAGLFLGAVGLGAAAGLSSWLELGLLSRALRRSLTPFRLPIPEAGAMIWRAALALLPALGVEYLTRGVPRVPHALAVVVVYAGLYFWLSRSSARPEIAAWIGRSGGGLPGQRGGQRQGQRKDPPRE
jgi:putative peptidoglycan lipid II flippase